MKGNYTHYIVMPNTDTAKKKIISTRYDWQTFTYKDVEKTGKKDQPVTLPTEDNTKSEIKSFMDTHSIKYSSSDTKSKLLEKVSIHCFENGTPTEEVTYKYIIQEVDKTTDHKAKVSDMVERDPLYFSARISADESEMCIKSDFTLAELNALPTGFTAYTNEELKTYIASSSKWKDEE